MLQLSSDKHPHVPRRRTRADTAPRRCPSRGGGRGSSCRLCTGSVSSRRSAHSPCGTAGTSGRCCRRKTQRGTSSRTSWGRNREHLGFGASSGHLPLPAPVTVPVPTAFGASPSLGSNLSSFTSYSCNLQCLESHSSHMDIGTVLSQL